MLGTSTPEMVASVSNAGCLGSLPLGGLNATQTQKLLHQTKQLTDKPFMANLFVYDLPKYQPTEAEPMMKRIIQFANDNNYTLYRDVDIEDVETLHSKIFPMKMNSYKEQIPCLLEENIPVVSFTFGCLDHEDILLFKKNNTYLIGTATSVEEYDYLVDMGIDSVVLQGIEAGGHRGTFMFDKNKGLPEITLSSLIQQITYRISTQKSKYVPLIAAGGISTPQAVRSLSVYDITAVQIGTLFIGSVESKASRAHKEMINQKTSSDTILTRIYSGRWARGFQNKFMLDLESPKLTQEINDDVYCTIPTYPIQNELTGQIRQHAQAIGDISCASLWSGQSCYTGLDQNCSDILTPFIKEFQ